LHAQAFPSQYGVSPGGQSTHAVGSHIPLPEETLTVADEETLEVPEVETELDACDPEPEVDPVDALEVAGGAPPPPPCAASEVSKISEQPPMENPANAQVTRRSAAATRIQGRA
jgi:hypothetical protein